MKIPASEVKKIIIFRALQLGDLLCTVPAFRALRKAYPDAEITLAGLPWAKSMLERFPEYIDKFIWFPGYPGLPEQEVNPQDFTQFLTDVQNERYDLALQMQGNGSVVNSMVEIFGAKYTAGFYKPDHYYPDNELFLKYPEQVSEIERHVSLMNFLGVASQGTGLEFPLTAQDQTDFNELTLDLKPKSYVCIHPGSRGAWRQWPTQYFAILADYAIEQGFEAVITGTKDELKIVDEVVKKMNRVPVIAAGKTTVGAVGVLIKNAFALISNCTGVSHMASAFKTPSIVISMDGEPERWAPLNRNFHRVFDWTVNPDFDAVFEEAKDLFQQKNENINV
ncbi:MAG: glycosyl transferase family 9 [Daejeonella sp.]|nr:glycosyl transferase family 9 [Daejeonella sp.]